ncbi:MAG TPA: thioesterase family protein [Alphaproteobacteria bacterium]
MNLLLRLILTLVTARLRGPIRVLDESRLRLCVLPTDLDTNLHMNNGRYLSIMDLGRVDYVARVGLLRIMIRNRWMPLVGSATIRYRRPLQCFDRFELVTRTVCWDDKWIFMEQRFERRGELVAQAYVKVLFKAAGRTLRSREVLKALGQEQRSPHMPPAIEALRLAEGLSEDKTGRA